MERFKKLIKTKKFLTWSIFIVTLFIFVGFFWLIYHKDQPKIVPPETRGEIREGIKEEVVKQIQSVWPSGGKVISDAAYGSRGGSSTVDISNWNTYRDESLGVEFKYPQSYSIDKSGEVVSLGNQNNNETGIWFYNGHTSLSAEEWWKNEKKKYDATFSNNTFESQSGLRGVKATTNSGLQEVHYIFTKNGKYYDILAIGPSSLEEVISSINFL